MDNLWSERQTALGLLEDRLKKMERENKGSVERERKDKQHQLEVYFRDMKEKYAKERKTEQKRHEERVAELESKCQLEWRAKVVDMEHLLQKERVIAQRKEQVLLRVIELGRIAKMETLSRTDTKMGKERLSVLNTVKQVKEECHDTERREHSKSNIREQVEKAERRIENEQQKEIKWKQQRSQEMADKLKEMLQQFEMDKKRIEEKWMEIEKKSQEGWKERVRNLEIKLENEKVVAQQRKQELLKHREEQEKEEGELLRIARQKENEMKATQRVQQTHTKTELENVVDKGKESLSEVEQKEEKRKPAGTDLQNGQNNPVNKKTDMHVTAQVTEKEQPFLQNTPKEISEKVGVKPVTEMTQPIQETECLREFKRKQERDVNSGSNIKTVGERKQQTCEHIDGGAETKTKHSELEDDWFGDMSRKKKEGTCCEIKSSNQLSLANARGKMTEREEKPVVEQKKTDIKELGWLMEMRHHSGENKDIFQQKKQPFVQDTAKDPAEKAGVKPVAEKQQPIQEMKWLRESKQKQERHVDLGKAEINTKHRELEDDWLEDMILKKKDSKLGEMRRNHQQNRADVKVKVTDQEEKSIVVQKKSNIKEMNWLTEMRQHAGENKDIIQQKKQPFFQDAPKETVKQQPNQEIEWLRESKQKQERDLDSESILKTVGERRQRTREHIGGKTETKMKHWELEDDLLKDMNLKKKEDKWSEIMRKHEQSRAESRQELEKQKDQGEHREKNKDTVVRPRRRGNEDRKTGDDEGKLLGVNEQEAKRQFSMRNKGIDFLYELKQDVVKGKRERLVDGDGPKESCVMTSRRVEGRGRPLERKELERREQLGDWLQDIDIKTEREGVIEQKTEEPLKTKNPLQDSKQSTMNNFKREWQVSSKTVNEENNKTEGISTMSRRREDSKTGAINQVKKEELMKDLFKEKEQETTEERWHELTEKRQRGMAENPQETVNERKHEPQMFRLRQNGFVTQEDEQKSQILRLAEQNPKQDIKTEECCQTSLKIERWTRGWMQTEKNDAKHGTEINVREDKALWVTRGCREEDRQANTGDVVGAKAGRRSTGTYRQQEGLKDDDIDAQVCRLWKSTNQTALEDTPLCSDYRAAMSVQQRAAINAQENTVPGTEAEHKTDRNIKTLQVNRQREKEGKKETSITIRTKENAWMDTRVKNELKSVDVMGTNVLSGRERHQRKKIIQEENAWQRELEMKSSEAEEYKPRDRLTQERQRLLKPQKQIEDQEMEKEKERDSCQIEKQKELRQQKKAKRDKGFERQKEQDKQLQTEKLNVLESHRDTNREKLKLRHNQSDKDLEQPEMAANTRRRRNAGARVALCWQSNSNEKPKRDAGVERKDEPVVTLKEQAPQHSNNRSQTKSLAPDARQMVVLFQQSESDREFKREVVATTPDKRRDELVRQVPQHSSNHCQAQSLASVALCEQSKSDKGLKGDDDGANMPAERKDTPVVNTEGQMSQQSSTPHQAQDRASGPSDEEEETGSAAPSAAGEGAQQEISGAAEKSEETAGGEAVKKDKSMRRRFLGWVNKKAKDYYNNKIEKTMKREQEEGDQVYQSWFKKSPMSRAEREKEKRKSLVKAEERRHRMEESWKQWEVKRAEEKKRRKKEDEEIEAMLHSPEFRRTLARCVINALFEKFRISGSSGLYGAL
ncbi:hypothetical protein ACEWY4_018862 [Coilia grayii]|uniref:Trichohyalin-like n=1 Tax=Coilia grayii TaxID=363190 RepID=A0ABD1JEQ4_9TELE